jgi:glycosyltransferase involved in cell wall biosynthesis
LRIVLDLEAAQMPQSRQRGIGRYSLALAQALLRHRGPHEILVALNGMYSGTVDATLEQLDGLVARKDVRIWHSAQPAQAPANAQEKRAMQLVREAFFASLDADVVHVSSVFPFGPFSLPTVGGGRARHRTSVTLYDLIPHLRRDVYLRDPQAAEAYDEQLAQLRRADLWLAISES